MTVGHSLSTLSYLRRTSHSLCTLSYLRRTTYINAIQLPGYTNIFLCYGVILNVVIFLYHTYSVIRLHLFTSLNIGTQVKMLTICPSHWSKDDSILKFNHRIRNSQNVNIMPKLHQLKNDIYKFNHRKIDQEWIIWPNHTGQKMTLFTSYNHWMMSVTREEM